MKAVIQLDKVRKQYGSRAAVDDITMDIHEGEIFGIVGPNGAGKTTLIEIIEGLRTADSGVATVLGMDIRKHAEEIKQRIGVLLQSSSIPEKAKVKEVFQLFASFYKKPVDLQKVTRFLGLEDKQNEYIKSLSGGWKQRVSLALTLINDPAIVFLDEPSMGLDPNARNEMWQMILSLKQEGRTIVVTTHYMEEAETLCDRVALIDKGRLIALDTPKKLISLLGGTRRIGFKNTGHADQEALSKLSGVTQIEWKPDWIKLHSNDKDQTLKQLFHLAEQENWLVSELTLENTSMNDVFSEMTMHGKGNG
ncbi:ABC transporter ATP-binding protein [Paenibacillus eucommiae]|uniref:ABC-2 type transport system ATP-binding protein n=1 Tax=Paenibacillus eucommiae TaxID=1355755 RepID=A0ABS4JCF5_9BACL|nr:ABC transporter ATP-binding protein [Paenibacillus eucommiae]MBP1996880.1 ABC-2 type transport system ATP-binding protein [Paenibacillus eucommiae]